MIASLALLVAAAGAPTDVPSLRHVVYSAHVDVVDSTLAKLHGPSAQEYNPPVVGNGDHVISDVTIAIDVLAALPDRTLVVQISEAGKDRNAAPERVGILADGTLAVPPSAPPLFTEESQLLGLMARDLVSGHDLQKGASWDAATRPKMTGSRTFRVASADDAHAHLDYNEETMSTDAAGLTIRQNGSFDYDIAHSLPVSGDMEGVVRTQTSFVNTQEHIVQSFALQSDSLGAS